MRSRKSTLRYVRNGFAAGVLLLGAASLFWLAASQAQPQPTWSGAGDPEVKTTITGCSYSSTTATVQFQVLNSGLRVKSLTIRFEFRDAENEIFTASDIKMDIRPRDSVRGGQTVKLPSGVSGGTCGVAP